SEVSEPEAEQQPQELDSIDMAEIRRIATQDALAFARKQQADREQHLAQQPQPDLAAAALELEVLREEWRKPFNSRLKALLDERPDGKSLLAQASSVPMTAEIADELLFRPGGAEATLYLLEHPAKARELANKPKHAAIGEVAALAMRFDPAFRARPVSKAEAPIRPLSGNSAKSSVPADDMSYQDFKRMREREIKARYRR